jgi:hypothetical protein
VLSTSTCGQSGEAPCTPPNPAPLHLGQSFAWSTSNGYDDQHQTPVGRPQNALGTPIAREWMKRLKLLLYALRARTPVYIFVSSQRGRRSTSNKASFGALKGHAFEMMRLDLPQCCWPGRAPA